MKITHRIAASLPALLVGAGLSLFPASAQETPAPTLPVLAPTPDQARMQAVLQRETTGLPTEVAAAITAFYADRDFAPYWTEGDGAAAESLLAALDSSADQGLPAAAYDTPALEAALAATGPDAWLRAEVVASTAYLVHARHLTGGLVNPGAVDPEINVRPARPSASSLLDRLDAGSVDETLAALAPASPDYDRLVAEKMRLAELVAADPWGAGVPEGPTLREGESGPRVAALRGRLDRMGYPSTPATPEAAATFDAGLAEALMRFQRDYGLNDDGAAGAKTLSALNASPEARLRQVLVNLERLRWQGNSREERYIEVNIPDYSAVLRDGDATPWRTRTVVGEAGQTRTPEFSDRMTYFVVNPTWHIPDSIAQRVYLPRLKNDPNTLVNSNMRLFTRSGTEINPRLVDFTQYQSGNFPFRIKQNPSSANALGRVKFMFPNQFAIYLHDTPSRDLFARDARAFSNGCIRLQEPLELAYILLEGQVGDPEEAFAGWLAAGTERHVNLDRPIPVHIGYRTVFVDDAGEVRFREDIYGRDAKVFRALEAAGVTIPAAQG
jgi:murein L,D-transpeptidase YcbB/YkuD